MGTQSNETQAIKDLINGYAEVLTTANIKAIGGYFTSDGLFLPNGYRTLNQQQLEATAGDFFDHRNFKIEYQIKDIAVHGDFAFIESVATTATTLQLSNNQIESNTSRDLFVLRKDSGVWKIYRYMFNVGL